MTCRQKAIDILVIVRNDPKHRKSKKGMVIKMVKQVKRGEIYYADLSPVIGSEQSGIRPVLIIQNDRDNNSSPTTIVAAITSSKTKSELPTHVTLNSDCLLYESTVLLEQIRTIDKTRLGECVGCVDATTMKNIDRAIIASLEIGYIEVDLDE